MQLRDLLSHLDVSFDEADIPSMNAEVKPSLKNEKQDESCLLFLTDSIYESKKKHDLQKLDGRPYAVVASDESLIENQNGIPIIRSNDVRATLAHAYFKYYNIDYNSIKVIGITGTNGKTTTATIIYEILTKAGYKAALFGTGKIIIDGERMTNSEYSMTTPDPDLLYRYLSLAEKKCDYAVMEISSHSIALGKVAPIKFEYGIFTNISSEHLDFHKDMSDYFTCKLRLFDQVKKGLFNLDDRMIRDEYPHIKCNKSSVGIIHDAEAYATDIEESMDGADFYYRESDLIFKINSKLRGGFNIYNSLMALKCVIDLGIKPCIAKYCLSQIEGIDGRMNFFTSDINVAIDYAHTPFSMYNCLKYLKSKLKSEQKLILVFGCGGNRDKTKRISMAKIASEHADKIIITEDNSRSEDLNDIIYDIAKGIETDSYTVYKDRRAAIVYAITTAAKGDTVAIIGKGHEEYIIKNGSTLPYSEKSTVLEAMEIRRSCHES